MELNYENSWGCLVMILRALLFIVVPAVCFGEPVKIGFGSCIKDPSIGPWEAIAEKQPDLFIFLGDNVYLKKKEWKKYKRIRKKYKEIFGHPSLRTLLDGVKVGAVWDDHDFGPNNSDSSNKHKKKTLKAFREQWGTPASPDQLSESIAHSVRIKNLLLIFTDNRSYRRNPERIAPTLFGEKQLEWIEERIKTTDAEVIVFVSGGQILPTSAPKGEGAWQFPEERERLIQLFSSAKQPLVIVSGDKHFAEILELETSGKGILEVTASPLAAGMELVHPRPKDLSRGSHFDGVNFGMLEVESRSITAKIYDRQGKMVLSHQQISK